MEDLLFGTSMFEGQENRTQLPKNQVVVCCFTQNFGSPSNSSTCPSSLSPQKKTHNKKTSLPEGFSRFHGNKMASPKQFWLINFTFPTFFVEPGLTVLHPKHLKFFLLTAVAAEWCGFKFDQNPCEGWDENRNFMDTDFGDLDLGTKIRCKKEFPFDLWFFSQNISEKCAKRGHGGMFF